MNTVVRTTTREHGDLATIAMSPSADCTRPAGVAGDHDHAPAHRLHAADSVECFGSNLVLEGDPPMMV